MYKAIFPFAGQDGEMSLAQDDIVGLVEKDDNGKMIVFVGHSMEFDNGLIRLVAGEEERTRRMGAIELS
jgi:hypothetical protein